MPFAENPFSTPSFPAPLSLSSRSSVLLGFSFSLLLSQSHSLIFSLFSQLPFKSSRSPSRRFLWKIPYAPSSSLKIQLQLSPPPSQPFLYFFSSLFLSSRFLPSPANHHLLPCFSRQQHGFLHQQHGVSCSWSHAWRGVPPHFSSAASSSNIYKKTKYPLALQRGSTSI